LKFNLFFSPSVYVDFITEVKETEESGREGYAAHLGKPKMLNFN
jgi:hypothetical protein